MMFTIIIRRTIINEVKRSLGARNNGFLSVLSLLFGDNFVVYYPDYACVNHITPSHCFLINIW